MASGLDYQIRGIVDNIVFSKDEVWAYYSAETSGYDFLDEDSKAALLANVNQTFLNLSTNRDSNMDWHLIVTNTPIDVDHWEDQYLSATDGWDRGPGFNQFLAKQVDYLRRNEFMTRKIYLGIKIDIRHGVSTKGFMASFRNGWHEALAYISDSLFGFLKVSDYSISDKEISRERSIERDVFNTMRSNMYLPCNRPTTEELALIIKRTLYPAMPTPYLDVPANGRWGKGDIARETGADMEKNRRWTKISQPINGDIMIGYRATLSFSKFPEKMMSPPSTPWAYMMQGILSIPFDMYARFTVIPNSTMKKKISRQKADIIDEGGNAGAVGVDAPLDLQEDYQSISELEAFAQKNDEPFLDGVYRLVITAPSEDELKERVEIIKTQYASKGIVLTWTVGDQQDLLLEYMPGDKIRERSFIQNSNIELIGASGFNIYTAVGDNDYYGISDRGGRS